ncbi:MAG: hypothetical protein M4D80_12990 [Myxococcota bacterium]|nr:hypothetical protein [Myxococcota bacterium]
MADSDELIKNAGKFFRKLGGQIKDTAQAAGTQIEKTAKQVTGLGRGTVKLELDQIKAAPGATIVGRVVLALTEPVDAKRLVVSLRARQKHLTVKRDSSGKTVGTSHAEVYQFERELGGAKRYESETLAFELVVPPDALDLKAGAPTSPLGEVVRTVASAVSPTIGPVEWQIVVELEISWGRNLSHDVDIVVA